MIDRSRYNQRHSRCRCCDRHAIGAGVEHAEQRRDSTKSLRSRRCRHSIRRADRTRRRLGSAPFPRMRRRRSRVVSMRALAQQAMDAGDADVNPIHRICPSALPSRFLGTGDRCRPTPRGSAARSLLGRRDPLAPGWNVLTSGCRAPRPLVTRGSTAGCPRSRSVRRSSRSVQVFPKSRMTSGNPAHRSVMIHLGEAQVLERLGPECRQQLLMGEVGVDRAGANLVEQVP